VTWLPTQREVPGHRDWCLHDPLDQRAGV